MSAPEMSTNREPLHRHWLVFHRHPDWHGHCKGWVDVGRAAIQHLLRGHSGETLLCAECAVPTVEHSCWRWHFHLSFKHRHTETCR